MVKSDNSKLAQHIHRFLAEYASVFESLMASLNEAQISHYSSGCGLKSVTFQIFPASDMVKNMLGLLSLDREYKETTGGGLKDYSENDRYNPGLFFIMYLRRWSGFAKIVMHNEGDSPRGIAAAKAKLIMEDLIVRLGNVKGPLCRANRKKIEQTSAFVKMMAEIGLELTSHKQKTADSHLKNSTYNYHKAMTAALENRAAA